MIIITVTPGCTNNFTGRKQRYMHNYEVNLAWNHDRLGTISSPALSQSIEIATPPEFP